MTIIVCCDIIVIVEVGGPVGIRRERERDREGGSDFGGATGKEGKGRRTHSVIVARERLIEGPSHLTNEGGDDGAKLNVGELLADCLG